MTTDKIKPYLSPSTFNQWMAVTDIDTLTNAEAKLSREIELGIVNGRDRRAELKLLRMLIESN